MPFLHLTLSAPPSPALTAQVAAVLTQLTSQVLRKSPELTSIALNYVDPTHWLVAGKTLAEQGLASFFLDLRITDGTNTKDEKAAYQQQVFAQLGELLGPLHPVSYVCIHDVRAEAYGYGGLTQEFRYVQGKLKPVAAPSSPSHVSNGLHVPA
ncbi:tautomerase family protein [Hymenobacter terrenus]|uniref:tautomerase family protein n=1 Tax=Hymenobacter terrenus TaxID=1629124 RepID=UPI00061920CB|nr:4-oxalocrotonate tautomerase family protein [Hymenobacter terrenus]